MVLKRPDRRLESIHRIGAALEIKKTGALNYEDEHWSRSTQNTVYSVSVK